MNDVICEERDPFYSIGQEHVALLAEGKLGEAAVQLHGEDELVQRVHLLRLQDRHPCAEVAIQLTLLHRKYTAEIMGPNL